MMKFYKLTEDEQVVECSLKESATCDRRIKQEDVGEYWVSTVFLTMDHSYHWEDENAEDYKPLIFETMIRNTVTEQWEDYQERYRTYEDALAGHNTVVERLKQGLPIHEE